MRQAAILAGAAALLACTCVLIVMGGGAVRAPAPPQALPESEPTAAVPSREGAGGTAASAAARRRTDPAAADAEGTEPALPPGDGSGLEREPPRGALSELGQALPPRPTPPDEWKGTILPRPVATAAGLIEAKGYRLAVAGVDAVPADETCSYEGRSWPCGVSARTAFRAFLRGRSVSCVVPPEPDREIIVAGCTVGKQDVAAWLVENGWARAAAGGEYAALGETAEQARKGIFGRPSVTVAPSSFVLDSALPAPPPGSNSILAAPLPEAPAETAPAPPAFGPDEVFPMPPAPPPAPAQ